MDDLFRFPNAKKRDPDVEAWFTGVTDPLRVIAKHWFDRMRACGPDVRELLQDGYPTACAGDAAFGYVNAFKAHLNVGFYNGASLPDPAKLLEGTGKRMRHVKVRPGSPHDEAALGALIAASYKDMKRRA